MSPENWWRRYASRNPFPYPAQLPWGMSFIVPAPPGSWMGLASKVERLRALQDLQGKVYEEVLRGP